MSSESHHQLAADMQALSLDERVTPPDQSAAKPRCKRRVNCWPLPPLKEYHKPLATGDWYYAIYVREGAIENYAVQVNPELAQKSSSLQYFYGIDYLRELAGDPDLAIHFGIIRRRHKRAMPYMKEKGATSVLCLFPFPNDLEEYRKRMSAKKVEALCKALGSQADWYEISSYI